jgi:hypothetical protein
MARMFLLRRALKGLFHMPRDTAYGKGGATRSIALWFARRSGGWLQYISPQGATPTMLGMFNALGLTMLWRKTKILMGAN